jgi:hypothetical protein
MTRGDGRLPWALRVAVLIVGGALWCACDDCNLSVSTGTLPNATVGVRYSAELNSACGGDTWFLQNGNLPPGIGLQDNGDLGGIPSTPAGIYNFTVGVFDFGSGETAYRGESIQLDPAPPQPTPTTGS